MDELKSSYRVATLIGVAMIVTILIYIVLVEVLKRGLFPEGSPPLQEMGILRYAFFALAVVQILLIRYVREIILSRGNGIQRLLVATIVTFALCESIAILGLILFLLGRDSFDFYCLAGLAMILFILYFPKYSQWEDWIRAKQGA